MMPGDTDILAVLADVVGTPDPIGLLQALEEKGVTVTPTSPKFDPVAQRAAVADFTAAMAPMWEQVNSARADLLSQGWSDENAEHLASHIAHMWFNVMEANMMSDVAVETSQRLGGEQDG